MAEEIELTNDERRVLRYIAKIHGCIDEDLYGCFRRMTNVEVEGILHSLTQKGLLARKDEYYCTSYGVTEAGRAAIC